MPDLHRDMQSCQGYLGRLSKTKQQELLSQETMIRVRRRTWYSWKILLYPLYPTESHFMDCLMGLCNDLTWAWLRFFPVPHTWVSIFWIVSCFNFLTPLVLIHNMTGYLLSFCVWFYYKLREANGYAFSIFIIGPTAL